MFEGWIDTHTHLNMLKEVSPSEAIANAKAQGVKKFINIGTNSKDHPIVLNLAETHPEVFATLGVHPHDAENFVEAKDFMLKNLGHDKVVAVGEIGLDFYYDNAPRELQIEVFNEQMSIAESQKLPVQIHTRDAEDETIAVLKKYSGKVGGVLHCFSGSRNLAEKALDYGFNISISGIVTFKSAQDLRDTIRDVVPLDRIHVETDAPYLAPVPYRGKENQPAYVISTSKVVAELKRLSLEEVGRLSQTNTEKLFSKLV